MKRLILDWRGGNPDFSKFADWYSIANTALKKPVLGNPSGRTLVAFSPMVMYDGATVASTPYNMALAALADRYGAMTDRTVWQGAGNWHTRLVDLTRRGILPAVVGMWLDDFTWADGMHMDYASAWSWQFPDMAPTDGAWGSVLAALATIVRQKGKICLTQQFHLTPVTMAGSGLFCEGNGPYDFGYSPMKHEDDLRAFRAALKWADPSREILWVQEFRNPEKWDPRTLANLLAWCDVNGIVASVGRDATAVGA